MTESSDPTSRTRRVFFALKPSEDTRLKIEDLQSRLQKAAQFTPAKISWVPANNFHITFFFLGDLKLSVLEKLQQNVSEQEWPKASFRIDFRKISFFPNDERKPPSVLWLGINHPPEILKKLREQCASVILKSGLKVPDQDFTPHITLARFRGGKGLKAVKNVFRNYEHVKVGVDEQISFHLMESVTGNGPSVYESLQEIKIHQKSPWSKSDPK